MEASVEVMNSPKPIHNADLIYVEDFGALKRSALRITNQFVWMVLLAFLMLWTILWIGWLGWNTVAPKSLRIKPRPAFVRWLFRYY